MTGMAQDVCGSAGPPASTRAQQPGDTCHTLAYQGGYASFAVEPYATYRFTTNMEQCCELCQQDEGCEAWSRSAGPTHAEAHATCMLYLDQLLAAISSYITCLDASMLFKIARAESNLGHS